MATIKIVLKKRKAKKEHRVALRLSHLNTPARYISLPLISKEEQWNKDASRFRKNKKDYKKLNRSLDEIEEKAENILSAMLIHNDFSFERFRSMYFKKKDLRTVKQVFIDKLLQLEQTKRYGSLITYKGAYSALCKYTNLDIMFHEVDFRFLKGFEEYQRQLGNKNNTIGNYLRSFRALHYEYSKMNDLPEPLLYRNFNVARLTNATIKRSISMEQLKKLVVYKPQNLAQQNAQLLFLFSLYTRGMNLMDMLQLQPSNIDSAGVLTYYRKKTGAPLIITLIPDALNIINQFKNEGKYLFPYIRKKDKVVKYRIRDVNRMINVQLHKIGSRIGVEGLTFYFARHTYADLARKNGTPIELISQALGHSSLKTTETYLRGFDQDQVDAITANIIHELG